MNTYTKEQKAEALKNVPAPMRDFIGSSVISTIYQGIFSKLRLNLQQGFVVSEIVNATLLGLEQQSALEHTLHQDLPELSNDAMRELIADINDRIFKEAQRRVRENITNPDKKWDEETFGDEKTYKIPLSDAELEKLAEIEEKNGGFKEKEHDIGPEEPLPKKTTQAGQTPISVPTSTATITPAPQSIATSKLLQPTENPTIATEVQRPIQKIAVTPPPAPRLKGDSDPYRELPD